MKSTFRTYLVGATAILVGGLAGLAWAQPAAAPPPAPSAVAAPPPPPRGFPYAIQALPEFKGTVARYTLTPRGDVDGLLLGDGTEVHFPPHMSAQLVYAIKPGDAITVRGLKAYGMPLIDALAISNDASGQTVVDRGPRAMVWADRLTSAQGRVQTVLHGKRGEVNGAILEDGTILRFPPPEAQRFAVLLTPGQSINAQGDGLVTPLGRVIDVQTIGQGGMQYSVVRSVRDARDKGGKKGRRPPPLAFAAALPPPAAAVARPPSLPAAGPAAPGVVAPPPPPPGPPPPPRR